MFTRKEEQRKEEQPIASTRIDNLIGESLRVVGDVYFSGGLRIDGQIEGNVICAAEEKNLVVISARGSVTGRVSAHDAVINGAVTGGLIVRNFLELQANANVTGNIRYRQLQVARGAQIEGRLQQYSDNDEQAAINDARAMHEEPNAVLYSVQYTLQEEVPALVGQPDGQTAGQTVAEKVA